MMPTPLSNILIVFAVTISGVEDSILYGVVPFILAFVNEAARTWAVNSGTSDDV